MSCTRCGSPFHSLSQCPWPSWKKSLTRMESEK